MDSNAVAVVGMSCRFPGCNDPETFWEKLYEGADCITNPPVDRPYLHKQSEVPFQGGFLACPVDTFDASFWGFNPREASYVDPQQRLLLEVSWEALERSGINPLDLKGSDTSVFLGIWQQDYDTMLPEGTRPDDFFRQWLCNSFSCAASRLSHILGLNGASQPYEAACASSLVALHNAVQALRQGSTSLAIVGGVNLILSTKFTSALAGPGSSVLAPDFRCKTFDVSANGYVRSEGCAAVILKRLTDATNDGDNILGVILGSACNTDGAGTSFGAPNPVAQAKVFSTALLSASVQPEDVSYLEAHGTGTAAGDPTEISAVSSVYATPKREKPLIIGAVKANIGHSEAASGLASFIKALLCIKHGSIPQQIHLKELNPKLILDQIPAVIPTENTPWKTSANGKPRICAVNSFGMSGTNVHVILKEPPSVEPQATNHCAESCYVVPISANDHTALKQLLHSYSSLLKNPDAFTLEELAASSSITRAQFSEHRCAFLANDLAQLRSEILKQEEHFANHKAPAGRWNHNIGFLFTGQGSHYFGMAKELFDTIPIFRRELEAIDKLFTEQLHVGLPSVLWGNPDLLDSTLYAQPAIFCVQVALTQLWRCIGVTPTHVVGHSLGEFAAAVCAGILTVEDGLRMVIRRAELIESLPGGAMLAVNGTNMPDLLNQFLNNNGQTWIDVAALNSPTDVVVSAEPKTVESFEKFCASSRGLFTRRLTISHAFHSRAMDTILEPYEELLEEIEFCAPTPGCTYISASTGKPEQTLSATYWLSHLRNSVQFATAIQHIGENCSILLEVGPQPVLLGLTRRNLDVNEMLLISSLKRDGKDRLCLYQGIKELYTKGVQIDWAKLYESNSRGNIQLPTYPFQRKRYWFKETSDALIKQTPTSTRSEGKYLFLGIHTISSFTYHEFESILDFNLPALSYLLGHRIGNKIIFPAAGYLEMLLALGAQMMPSEEGEICVENLNLESALEIEENQLKLRTQATLETMGHEVGWKVTIWSTKVGEDPQRRVSASLKRIQEKGHFVDMAKEISLVDIDPLPNAIHDKFSSVGFNYNAEFKSINHFGYNKTTATALTQLRKPLYYSPNLVCHPIVLDAILQTGTYARIVFVGLEKLTLPIKFRRLKWFGWNRTGSSNGNLVITTNWGSQGDICMYDGDTGKLLLKVEGLEFYIVSLDQFISIIEHKGGRKGKLGAELYEIQWQPVSRVETKSLAAASKNKKWLIISGTCNCSHGKLLTTNFAERAINPVYVEVPKDLGTLEYFQQLLSLNRAGLGGIVHLSLEEFSSGKNHITPILTAQHLTQAILSLGIASIQLLSVTIGAYVYNEADSLGSGPTPNPTAAAVQGFFMGFRAETPHIQTTCFDIDDTLNSMECLSAQIESNTIDDQSSHYISIRNGQIYAPKLLPARFIPRTDPGIGPLFTPEGTYLITGAGRGIGLALFEWMKSQGAQYFVLAARSEPQATLREHLANPSNKSKVTYVRADIGKLEDCSKLFEATRGPGFPPLRGIFHSAGVLNDVLVQNQTSESFLNVFQSKAGGAWNLHELSRNEKLDHFVLFSSIVSVIGNWGQSSYISANSYLDTLTTFRQKLGLPATVINWGAWSEIGMAASSRLGQHGDGGALKMVPISPEDGFEALEYILQRNISHTTVLGRGSRFTRMAQLLRMPSLLSTLVSKENTGQLTTKMGLKNPQIAQLVKEIESQCVEVTTIKDCVKAVVREVIGYGDDDEIFEDVPFTSMGMDSLMNIELISMLSEIVPDIRKFDTSKISEQTTVLALTTYVHQILATPSEKKKEPSLEEVVEKDATLPQNITSIGLYNPPSGTKVQHLLLTGGTGFVGSHFLAKLNQEGIKVTCLIRGSDGTERLNDTLKKFGLLNSVDMDRIKVIIGDVSDDQLGLDVANYDALAVQVDAIVHCAASVNHLEAYTGSVRHNALNMIPILKFATAAGKLKRVLFPSTLLTSTRMDSSNTQLLEEFPPTGDDENGVELLKAGYILSKYVAERLLGEASRRGIPCTLIRFPTLLGSTINGRFGTKYNHYSRLLLSCIKMGSFPIWRREEIPLMPVDVAVDIATRLFLVDIAESAVYNLTFDNMPTEADFFDVVKNHVGLDLDRTPLLYWCKKVVDDEDTPLRPFRQHYQQESEDGAMPTIVRWNILYTHMLSAKLNTTSGNILAKLPSVNKLTPNGKEILHQHLKWLEQNEPELCFWAQKSH